MADVIIKDVTKNFVTKAFGSVTAVDHLNLTIKSGECFSFLGPSGCGKTTTLRMIAGFEDLTEGEIWIGDKKMSVSGKNEKYYLPPEKRGLGMVFQAFAVWPHMNVFENIAFPLKVLKMNKTDIVSKVKVAMEHTSLTGLEKLFPYNLSGGQQQRIALARAIVTNPEVLLLDEPLSNLDPKLREIMRFEIKDLQRKMGFTIIYVTHDQAEAMALSDRMLVMDMGVIQEVGTPIDIYTKPANKFVFGFIGHSNFLKVDIIGKKVFPEGNNTKVIDCTVPDNFKEKKALFASRPNEIDLVKTGGYRTTIKSRVFLSDCIDYRVDIEGQELRVQTKTDQEYKPGDPCGVKFNDVLWYSAKDDALDKERERRKVI